MSSLLPGAVGSVLFQSVVLTPLSQRQHLLSAVQPREWREGGACAHRSLCHPAWQPGTETSMPLWHMCAALRPLDSPRAWTPGRGSPRTCADGSWRPSTRQTVLQGDGPGACSFPPVIAGHAGGWRDPVASPFPEPCRSALGPSLPSLLVCVGADLLGGQGGSIRQPRPGALFECLVRVEVSGGGPCFAAGETEDEYS